MSVQTSLPDPDYWRSRPRAPLPGTPLGPLEQIANHDAREYQYPYTVNAINKPEFKKYYYDCKETNLDNLNTNLDYYLDNFN